MAIIFIKTYIIEAELCLLSRFIVDRYFPAYTTPIK